MRGGRSCRRYSPAIGAAKIKNGFVLLFKDKPNPEAGDCVIGTESKLFHKNSFPVMKNLKVALIGMLLLSALSWWACNKDHLTSGGQIVDVAFGGRIIDESGLPVPGAEVRLGTTMVLTDDNGVFRTERLKLPDNDAILTVNKNGYFDFSRAYFVEDEALQTVTIQLLRKIQVGSFNNAAGGNINIPGGPTLKFPANATDASGTIRVFARYLDPTDDQLGLFMPGDLRAINAGGEEKTLGTFGMVAVELESAFGKAQIAGDKEVELSMPVLSTQASQAPSEIPLWYFDTEKARWIEEGSAQKIGDRYVGKVKHFSFWNCDVGLSLVQLSGKVYIGDLQHPLVNAQVKLTVGSVWPGYAFTDENGCFSGGVIKDEVMELTIQVFDQCGYQVLYTATIGPFSDNTTLAPIILTGTSAASTHITGSLVNCAGQPVTNGYIHLSPYAVVFADENGAFSYDILSCTTVPSITAQAFDLDNLKESPVQTVALSSGGGNVDIGIPLTVCTGLDEYIQYTLDGQQYTLAEPYGGAIDSMNTDQTIYLYISPNGTTSAITLSFNANQAGTYPLTYFAVNEINILPGQYGNITTNLTTFPATANDYFIGTFSGNFQSEEGNSHTISGNYRVKRDY